MALVCVWRTYECIIFVSFKFLTRQEYLSSVQFGFMKGKSTADVCKNLLNFITSAFENHLVCYTELCVLTKAFDCMSHYIFLEKVEYYGFIDVSYDILKSYLSERTQMITCNGDTSPVLTIDSGVPQGSILGLLSFVLYINDLPANLNTLCLLYAEDTTIAVHDKTSEVALK